MNFGVVPAVLMYSTLTAVPELGLAEGAGRTLLLVACGVWVLANVFRLAKFNVISENPANSPPMFYGVPTTLAAGTLVVWYLVFLEYSPLGVATGQAELMRGPRLLGDTVLPMSLWGYMPAAMLVGAFLMVSNLPTPKLGRLKSKALTVFVLVNVIIGFTCGFARILPEVMAVMPSTWIVVSLVWGQVSARARTMPPPTFLPESDEQAGPPMGTSDDHAPSRS